MALKDFNCTGCGACCRAVWSNRWFRENKYLRPDGACIHLTADNACDIYDTRPEVCRINGVYEKAGLVNIVPVEVWHDYVITSSCTPAILRAGLDHSKVPKLNHDAGKMTAAVHRYFAELGADQTYLPDPSYTVPVVKGWR